MISIKKLTVGIQPGRRMFRAQDRLGQIADAVLERRLTKPFSSESYFKTIGMSKDRDSVSLRNEELGNYLSVGHDNIVFSKHTYSSSRAVSTDDFFVEFEALWSVIEKQLGSVDTRRIGIVAEHRIADVDHPSSFLLRNASKFSREAHIAKFVLQFEERFPMTLSGTSSGIPDPKKDSFINVICHLYDAEVDADEPCENAVNCNLDVQHYFSPFATGAQLPRVRKVWSDFQTHWRAFGERLRALGVVPQREG